MVSRVGGPPGGGPPGAGGNEEEDSLIYAQLKKFINVIVSHSQSRSNHSNATVRVEMPDFDESNTNISNDYKNVVPGINLSKSTAFPACTKKLMMRKIYHTRTSFKSLTATTWLEASKVLA